MEILDDIKAAAKEVYRHLGSGHTEQAYEEAMEVELMLRGYSNIRRQVPSPIIYKDHMVGVGYIDIMLNDEYIIELKVVAGISLKDEAQVRKYLIDKQIGLLVNFNPSREMAEVITIEKPN